MNTPQRLVFVVASAVAAALSLFPPSTGTEMIVAEGRVSSLRTEFSGGHSFIASLPRTQEYSRETIPGPSPLHVIVYRLDYARLIVMLVAVAMLAACGWTLLGLRSAKESSRVV
jgi:hypothetical protein